MCGRYTLTTPLDELLAIFDVPGVAFDYRPRYNIAPTQTAPVLARDDEGRRIGLLRWGLIPFWADDPAIGNRMINARSETASSKPAFRSAFRSRRCLVLADGFFEWKKEGGGKQPYWIHRPDGEPFTMAGLWERWEPEDGEPIYTFTILTRDATEELRSLHPRMPVVLDRDRGEAWIERDRDREELEALIAPPPEEELTWHPVSTVVNSPRNDVPECVEPLSAEADA